MSLQIYTCLHARVLCTWSDFFHPNFFVFRKACLALNNGAALRPFYCSTCTCNNILIVDTYMSARDVLWAYGIIIKVPNVFLSQSLSMIRVGCNYYNTYNLFENLIMIGDYVFTLCSSNASVMSINSSIHAYTYNLYY